MSHDSKFNVKKLLNELHKPKPKEAKKVKAPDKPTRAPVAVFTMCGDPYIGARAKSSKHHKGHMRCVRERKRQAAAAQEQARQAVRDAILQEVAQKKEESRRRKLEAAYSARQGERRLVQALQDQASVQRKEPSTDELPVRPGRIAGSAPLALSKKRRRNRNS